MKPFVLRRTQAVCLLLASLPLGAGAVSVSTVLSSNLLEPTGLVIGSNDTIYVADGASNRLAKYSVADSTFQNLAGRPGVSGYSNGIGSKALFYQPDGLVMAPDGSGLIVSDSVNNLIRFVSLAGSVSNLAGRPPVNGVPVGGQDNGAAANATFNYPLGLAVDANSNLFVADSRNSAIRKVNLASPTGEVRTVVATSAVQSDTIVVPDLYQPGGVAVTSDGHLWIANTRNHTIYRVNLLPPNEVELLAGATGQSGTLDSDYADEARFQMPRGLYWSDLAGSLLICDSYNHAIRRLFFNNDLGNWSVGTYAGTPGVRGQADGDATVATFNYPTYIVFDSATRSYLVTDRGGRRVRRLQEGQPQPSVKQPTVGVVRFVANSSGALFTTLAPVSTAQIFNNDEIIAMTTDPGSQTYYSGGPTSADPLQDLIPNPGPAVSVQPPYFTGVAWDYVENENANDFMARYNALPFGTKIPIRSGLTLKAIGYAPGRQSSQPIVKAEFIFQVARPSVNGSNAASFIVETITSGAELWYTLDGTDPTNSLPSFGPISSGTNVSFILGDSNVTFKVRGFKPNYLSSDLTTAIFTPAGFVPNTISLGFENATNSNPEASSRFIASAGQRFYAPVTLTVLPAQKMYSFQFNVVVTNLGLAVPPVDPSQAAFQSMVMKLLPDGTFTPIPPAMAVIDHTAIYTNLLFTNTAINLLGVGWLERIGHTNLYDTTAQDLITYSQAHDTTFYSKDGKVILGGYSFVVPTTAPLGSQYQIQLGRASATSDGVSADVFIYMPTNGSTNVGKVNTVKTVTVGSIPYIVGDVSDFRWFNAGDFGNGYLMNNDVLQVFQSACYGLNFPPAGVNAYDTTLRYHYAPPGSDLLDAMDSCCGDILGVQLPSNVLFDGNDTTINQIGYGDGWLNVADVFVTFRRSLDPSLTWYARYWANGQRACMVTNNVFTNGVPHLAKAKTTAPKATSVPAGTAPAFASFSVDDLRGAAGAVLQAPIRVVLTGGWPLRIMMLNLTVQPLDGSPPLTQPVSFDAVSALGTPALTTSQGLNNFAAVWLDNTVMGLSGTNLVGLLTIAIPTNAPSTAAYLVRFDHVSGSPSGLGVFPQQTANGLITMCDRTGSIWNDGIPDSWRLRYFGSVSNLLSAADADADGDGVSNWLEFKAGTDPMNPLSKLQLIPSLWRSNDATGLRLQWPAGPNRRYILEYSTSLGLGSWLPITTNLMGDAGLPQVFDVNLSTESRFYRVRVAE